MEKLKNGPGVLKLSTPQEFALVLTGAKQRRYELSAQGLRCSFSAPASTEGRAKLYTVSDGGKLLYVGISSRRMSSRINFGLTHTGGKREYPYKWRHLRHPLALSVWTAAFDDVAATLRELEVVEAEVAFECRTRSDQWPLFQHEIHFHPSNQRHREAAARIYEHAVSRDVPQCGKVSAVSVAA